MNVPATFTLLLLGGLLSGCSMALFESRPDGRVTDCDPQFVGHWRLDATHESTPVHLVVAPECKSYRFLPTTREQGKFAEDMYTVSYVTVGDKSLLVIEIPSSRADGEKPHKGYVYFAYRTDGDEIHLHPVEDRHAAHLIVDEKLPGRVHTVVARPEDHVPLETLVIGTPAEMAKIVQRHDLFSSAYYTLTPVPSGDVPGMESPAADTP